MLTSYYAVTKDTYPGAICISRSAPRGAKYPHYSALKPGPWFKSVPQDKYIPLYFEILQALTAQQVWDDLHQIAFNRAIAMGMTQAEAKAVRPIALCWEKAGTFCHRRLFAGWIESELGIAVPEGKIVVTQGGPALIELPAWQP